MSTGGPELRLYDVSYTEDVRRSFRTLAADARRRGDGDRFVAALKEFHWRLQVYPQFGDPLVDLSREQGQLRIGVIPPLSMRYGVLENRRMVFVAARPVLLSRQRETPGSESGLDTPTA